MTHSLFSVRQKKENFAEQRQAVRFTEIIVRGANRDKNSLLGERKKSFTKEIGKDIFVQQIPQISKKIQHFGKKTHISLHVSKKSSNFAPEIDLFPLLHEKVSEKFRNIRSLITIIYAP